MRTLQLGALGLALLVSLGLAVPGAARTVQRPPLHGPALPRVAPFLGPPPTNCPVVNPKLVHSRVNHQPNSVPPIIMWVQGGALAGYSDWHVENHRITLGFGTRTKYGYVQKIFWQRTAGAPRQVRLDGWNLRTGEHVWFGRPSAHANLNALGPPPVIAWSPAVVSPSGAPSLTFIPSAGCYVIKATWRGGGWTLPFAAGG